MKKKTPAKWSSPAPSRPPAVEDEAVTAKHRIQGIPLELQDPESMLCGYHCVHMLQRAAGVERDPRFEARRQRWRWDDNGLSLQSVKTALLFNPGWVGAEEVKGNSQQVWEGVARAARCTRPAVLWIPRMEFFPEGHYVVVAGAGCLGSEHVLWLQDPFFGCRWMSLAEWTSPAHGPGSRTRWAFVAPKGWKPQR